MKSNKLFSILLLSIGMFLVATVPAKAQLWKKITKKAEDVVEKKLEKKTEEETGKAMDTILGNDGGTRPNGTTGGGDSSVSNGGNDGTEVVTVTNETSVEMYKKSDWIPGETLILFDDFSDDPVGDFPQLWNTKGSGELVTLSDNPEIKWLKLYNNTKYEPDLPKDLPKDFTVEFDVRGYRIDNKTSQTARFYVALGDGLKPLKLGRRYVNVMLSPYPGWKKDQELRSLDYEGNGELAAGRSSKDIRQAFQDGIHVAISVKGGRYRMYLDGEKIFDAPRAINDTKNFSSILFDTYGLRDDQAILITNLRVAEGLPEPRKKLFKTGSYSTTAITFDYNSDQLKPEAYGVLKQIAEAITSESEKNILIVGHTDSDGSDSYNQDLSERRAVSVKKALVDDFGVSAARLTTKGKGETEPVASNDTAMNKAKNRRTEFIIQ